jgi:hypothetical protein
MDWWEKIKIPPVPTRSHRLSYKAISPEGKISYHNNDAPCYGSSLKYLESHTFVVQEGVTGTWRPLEEDKIRRFMELATAAGLMPPETSLEMVDGKPIYTSKGTHHRMYAGLSLFRYILSYREIVLLVLECLDRQPSLSFYQALHFAVLYFNTPNNGFTDQVTIVDHNTHKMPKGHLVYQKIDLYHSVLLSHFFQSGECDKKKNSYKIRATMTSALMNKYAEELKMIEVFGVYNQRAGGLPLEKSFEVLWDEFTPLYDPNQKVDAEIKKDFEAAKKLHLDLLAPPGPVTTGRSRRPSRKITCIFDASKKIYYTAPKKKVVDD